MHRYFFILIFLIGSVSCTETITIKGFDKEGWFNDVDGCNGNRKAQVTLLIEHKEVLLGTDQQQIRKLLGKPDMHEIYKRSQRFYIYSIDPGKSCENYETDNSSTNLTLRFNALGRVHEVIYYN